MQEMEESTRAVVPPHESLLGDLCMREDPFRDIVDCKIAIFMSEGFEVGRDNGIK